MQINGDNYLGYFLLYADNELSASERLQVAAFLQQEPHLQAELDRLLATRIQADRDLKFPGKKALLQQDELPDLERLLDYLDDELTPSQRRQIEAELGEDTAVSRELEQLKAVYFQADKQLHYPRKAALYKPGILALGRSWPQWAAAAVVVLLLGAWLLLSRPLSDGNPGPQTLASYDSGKLSPRPQHHEVTAVPAAAEQAPLTDPAPPVPPAGSAKPDAPDREPVVERNPAIPGASAKGEPAASAPERVAVRQPDPVPQSVPVNPVRQAPVPPQTAEIAAEKPTGAEAGAGQDLPVSSEKQIATLPASKPAAKPEKTEQVAATSKKGLLRNIGAQIGDRALNILANGDDKIHIAGFAINIKH